jgi:hypothetical protein
MLDFLYERAGSLFAPTQWAGSPWSQTSQHGGPVNALFMRAAEEAAAEAGLRPARLTVDLFKPIPMEPLVLSWEFLRRGRKLALCEASLARAGGGGERVASARAVLLAPRDDREPYWLEPEASLPGPEGLAGDFMMPKEVRAAVPPGFHLSLEVRATEASDGPAVWIHTPLQLAEGEPMTPLERMAAIADMTFGVCTRMPPRLPPDGGGPMRAMLINTDTTLQIERPPEGEWFAFSGGFLTDRDGIGISEVTIHDRRGRAGLSHQTLVANDRQR